MPDICLPHIDLWWFTAVEHLQVAERVARATVNRRVIAQGADQFP